MKKPFKIGMLIGCLLGISVAFGMDLIMGGTIGNGGWFQAVATDLNSVLKTNYSQDDLIVIVCAILIVAVFVAINSFFGGIFFTLVATFLDFMAKKGK
ncbi:MAG: hypothetical protein N2511_06290 [Thermodesulfovibrionales bacterium]|nr:hypothetical protein [Thermodesulfovibrionales bacterium]